MSQANTIALRQASGSICRDLAAFCFGQLMASRSNGAVAMPRFSGSACRLTYDETRRRQEDLLREQRDGPLSAIDRSAIWRRRLPALVYCASRKPAERGDSGRDDLTTRFRIRFLGADGDRAEGTARRDRGRRNDPKLTEKPARLGSSVSPALHARKQRDTGPTRARYRGSDSRRRD